MKELLFMNPVFKEAVWGGRKLRDDFGYEIPSDSTGECWGIGAHKNGDCEIAVDLPIRYQKYTGLKEKMMRMFLK